MRKSISYVLSGAVILYWIANCTRSWMAPDTYDFQPVWFFMTGAAIFIALAAAHYSTTSSASLSRMQIATAVTAVVCTLVARPITSVDFMHFLFDGSLLHTLHVSPYVLTPAEIAPNIFSAPFLNIWWAHNPSPYGPLWQLAMVVVNITSANTVAGGIVALKILNLGGLLLCLWLVWRITNNRFSVWLLAINPIVLINTIDTPHADLWITVGILAAIAYHDRWQSFGGIVAGTLIKIHAIAFVPFLLRWQATKKILFGIAIIAATLCVLYTIAPYTITDMLNSNLLGSHSPQNSSSLAYLIMPHAPTGKIFVAGITLSALMYVMIAWTYLTRKISQTTALILCACIVPLFLTGLAYPWHWMIALILLHLHNPKKSLPWIIGVTIGAVVGPLPSVSVVVFCGISWTLFAYALPLLTSVLQYANHGTKTDIHHPSGHKK